jgi:beta-galactosidase
LDDQMLAGLKFSDSTPLSNVPAFWRGTFTLDKVGDTFLDLHELGKGDIWVNGHCLARFWNIGPSQTAYAPGCWLHAGTNEIVILDLLSPAKPEIAGLAKPVLDELHPEKDFNLIRRPAVTLQLDSATPVQTGTFAPGSDAQDMKFAAPATGRFFCLESLNAFDGKPAAAVAELDLLDASGKSISHNGWTIAYVDSEERHAEDGTAENAIDGQTANYWHTEWKGHLPGYPHQLILDLGQSQAISGFRYVPRQGEGDGRIKDYRIYVGDHVIQK